MADMATRKTGKAQRIRAAGAPGASAAGAASASATPRHLAPRLPRFEREAINRSRPSTAPGLSTALTR